MYAVDDATASPGRSWKREPLARPVSNKRHYINAGRWARYSGPGDMRSHIYTVDGADLLHSEECSEISCVTAADDECQEGECEHCQPGAQGGDCEHLAVLQ